MNACWKKKYACFFVAAYIIWIWGPAAAFQNVGRHSRFSPGGLQTRLSSTSEVKLPEATNAGKTLYDLIHPPTTRDIGILIDRAEFALLSYFPGNEILKLLRRSRSHVRVVQRNLDSVGATYNMIWYRDAETNEIQRVIAIPGSRNFKNMQENMDTKLEYDDILKIKVHRGYKTVYRAILSDFIREEKRIISQDIEWRSASAPDQISLSITGHSLGGSVGCMLAGALQSRGYTIDHVTVFGSPRFTDKAGSEALCQRLPIERIEHVHDPATLSPITIPMPFSDGQFAPLLARYTLLLEPLGDVDKSSLRDSPDKPDSDILQPPVISLAASDDKSSSSSRDDVLASAPAAASKRSAVLSPVGGVKRLLQGILRDPLASLGQLNWRGERVEERAKPQKHKVYAGSDALRRAGSGEGGGGGMLGLPGLGLGLDMTRMGDLLSANWQWHSMHAYLELLKDYKRELYDDE